MCKIVCVLLVFFFFFQAEDGIRDDLVTGVQTCALPIFCRRTSPPSTNASVRTPSHFASYVNCGESNGSSAVMASIGSIFRSRSEERRVGKEGRSRGSPYH